MKIEIEIKKSGKAKGTLGWLSGARTIKIGAAKDGSQAAWLLDAAGDVMTVLAVRDYGYESGIVMVGRLVRDSDCSDGLLMPHSCTDAAWEALEKIAEMARSQMRESAPDSTPALTVSFSAKGEVL